MGQGIDLLRMLEPAVRPTGVGCAGPQKAAGPIEERGFDELLGEARRTAPADDATAITDVGSNQVSSVGATGPLSQLGRIDAVENDALRAILAQAHNAPTSNSVS